MVGGLRRIQLIPEDLVMETDSKRDIHSVTPESHSEEVPRQRSYSVCVVEDFITSQDTEDLEYRPRAYSWSPKDKCKRGKNPADAVILPNSIDPEKKVLAVMSNIAHIVIGVAITQLGIVGTWYQRYMNFPKDQLRHVIYICLLFIILGVYGTCIVAKKVSHVKPHRITYIVLTTLSIIASCFVIANSVRMLLADTYQTKQTVVVLFDGLMIGLSGIEVPAAFVGLYGTVSQPTSQPPSILPTDPDEPKSPPKWSSIFGIILNVAHIVLGLCITELGMVGMLYRNYMNIDNTGLFAVVFVSLSFISVGAIGIYNQMSGKDTITCNRSMYTIASLVAVGCATVLLSFVSVAVSSKQYYTGIEAIVAFDVMILSMSGIELIVAVAAISLCLVPICISRLKY